MVKQRVDWFKQYRDILESDVIHGRRADGRDLDWMLHVNPALEEKGMLVVFNPLNEPVESTIRVNLYYTGLTETADIHAEGGDAESYELARDYTIDLPVQVPGGGMRWFVIRRGSRVNGATRAESAGAMPLYPPRLFLHAVSYIKLLDLPLVYDHSFDVLMLDRKHVRNARS